MDLGSGQVGKLDYEAYPTAASAAKSAAAIRERMKLDTWKQHLPRADAAAGVTNTTPSNSVETPHRDKNISANSHAWRSPWPKPAVSDAKGALSLTPRNEITPPHHASPMSPSLPGAVLHVAAACARRLAFESTGSDGIHADGESRDDMGSVLLSDRPTAQAFYQNELSRRTALQKVDIDHDTDGACTLSHDTNTCSVYPVGEPLVRLVSSAAVAEVLLFGDAYGTPRGDIFPVAIPDDGTFDAPLDEGAVRIVTPRPTFKRVWREGQAVRSEMRLPAPAVMYT